jgi:hypothetical protein
MSAIKKSEEEEKNSVSDTTEAFNQISEFPSETEYSANENMDYYLIVEPDDDLDDLNGLNLVNKKTSALRNLPIESSKSNHYFHNHNHRLTNNRAYSTALSAHNLSSTYSKSSNNLSSIGIHNAKWDAQEV